MAYQKSQMLFDDGKYYKWTASADHDNPFYRAGLDRKELNKTEGYEVLNFINRYADERTWTNKNTGQQESPNLNTYQKIERMIKDAPPRSTHAEVSTWIDANWNNAKYQGK